MEIHSEGRITARIRRRMANMFNFLRTMMICTAAGVLLSVVFLAPAGGVVGAMSGLLIGACVAMGEWKALREELAVAPIGPIRLIGSQSA